MAEYMYGIREDGSIVSIKDLDLTESGLRCKCKCPQCRRDLQACSLREIIVSRYFRHHNEGYKQDAIDGLNGCTATSANETGLHMMAKELIAETQKIALPAMRMDLAQFNLPFATDVLSRLPRNILLRDNFVLDCSDVVEVEKAHSGFRPDVSVTSECGTFLIEIAVTHKVSANKQQKVEEYGLPMIEIDLSGYVEVGITRESLRKLIVEDFDHKKWISFPREEVDAAYKTLTEEALAIQKRQEDLAKERKEYFSSKIYAAILTNHRNDYHFEQYAKKAFKFEATPIEYPFFIDIPISGEIVFTCDRRVWQGKIFDRWIYYRTSDSINTFSIWDSLTQEEHISYNPILYGKYLYPGVSEPTFLPYQVVRKYLSYLESLGFIRLEGQWATVLKKHSITPPNHEYAAQLEEAIQKVDGFSPLSSSIIEKKLHELMQAEEERKAEAEKKDAEVLAQQTQEQRIQDFYCNNICPQCGRPLRKTSGKKGTNWLCIGLTCNFHAFMDYLTGEIKMSDF